MLVPSMTPEEVFREIMRDYAIIYRRSSPEGKIYQKEMLRKGLKTQTRSISIKTIYCNEWNIIFQMDVIGIKTVFYVKANDKKGLVAYGMQFFNTGTSVPDKFVVKYNRHFLDRYNERLCLGFSESSKVIKHFFKNNFTSDLGQTEVLVNGIRCIHFIYKEGIGVGWQNDEKKTIHMKTFISNNMLTNHQRSLADHIKHGGDEEFFDTIQLHNLHKAF